MRNALIFHGTGGHPEENWFPWLKGELEKRGYTVSIPQFPTPEGQTLEAWFAVLKKHEHLINEEAILIGHSLGGAFLLRVLEKSPVTVAAAYIAAAPAGVQPIANWKGDQPFVEPPFDWLTIRSRAKKFVVFHSDNDPLVPLGNGELIAVKLGVDLTLIPGAGHFNATAGYREFGELLATIL